MTMIVVEPTLEPTQFDLPALPQVLVEGAEWLVEVGYYDRDHNERQGSQPLRRLDRRPIAAFRSGSNSRD